MSETDIAWLAGVFDGEGHISIYANPRRRSPDVRIHITNTHRGLVDEVRRVTGVGYITTRYHDSPNHKPTHDWHTTGGNAKKLLALMTPRLIVKKERAALAISGEYRLTGCLDRIA